MEPAAFTPRWLAGLDGTLSVYCATCREVREIPLRRLAEGARAKQPIAAMVFRCQVRTCRQVGAKAVQWRDTAGHWRHDYDAGETRPVERLPGIYGPPSGS